MAKLYSTKEEIKKAIMVQVAFGNERLNTEVMFTELKSLIQADNMMVVGQIFQNKKTPDSKFMIGVGKLEELKQLVAETNADIIVFKNDLNGSKIRNLEDELQVKVIDRTMLILDIFAQRATSQEGKLQVELAQLKYNLPRISAVKGSCGRFGASGVGTRGPGETKIELDKRVIEDRIVEKRRELKKVEENRQLRRNQRRYSTKKKVSIVGYTNGGKSTLLNVLTKADAFVEDMLFATLDTTTRNLWLGQGQEILITDTVGFVSDLPHDLIEAFKSTLEEAMDADLLLHVVDVSDELYLQKIDIVNEVLCDLGALNIPTIIVYNKVDKDDKFKVEENEFNCVVSARNRINIDLLKSKIIHLLYEK